MGEIEMASMASMARGRFYKGACALVLLILLTHVSADVAALEESCAKAQDALESVCEVAGESACSEARLGVADACRSSRGEKLVDINSDLGAAQDTATTKIPSTLSREACFHLIKAVTTKPVGTTTKIPSTLSR